MHDRRFDPWGLALGGLLASAFFIFARPGSMSFENRFYPSTLPFLLPLVLPQAALAALTPRLPGATLGSRAMLAALLHGAVAAMVWMWFFFVKDLPWVYDLRGVRFAGDLIWFVLYNFGGVGTLAGMLTGAGTVLALWLLRRPPLASSEAPAGLVAVLALVAASVIALSWEMFLWLPEDVLSHISSDGFYYPREPLSRLAGVGIATASLAGAWALLLRAHPLRLLASAALLLLALVSLRESARYFREDWQGGYLIEQTMGFEGEPIPPSGFKDYAAARGETSWWADDVVFTRDDGSEARVRVGWGPFRTSFDGLWGIGQEKTY